MVQVPRLLRVLKKAGSGARLVLLTSADRVVKRLGGSLPVWIGAEGWEEWAEELDDVFLGDAELWWVGRCRCVSHWELQWPWGGCVAGTALPPDREACVRWRSWGAGRVR